MSDEAIEAAKAYGNPVYSADDPAVKETADALAEEFHGFVQTATEEQLIRAAAEGYSAPYLYEVLNQQQAEIAGFAPQQRGECVVDQIFLSFERSAHGRFIQDWQEVLRRLVDGE